MQGKVEKCTFVSEWEWQGKKNYNFVVKFHGSEDRFVYVGKDKDNPKFKEGETVDYNIVPDKTIKVFVKDKTFEYPKIETVKPAFSGGGAKYTPPTKEQELNKFLGTVTSYAKDLVCHRVDTGKPKQGETSEEALADAVVRITNRIFDGLKDRIQ